MQQTPVRNVDPAAIEQELLQLWASLKEGNDARIVTRAAMSNVMILCAGEEQARDAAERVALLVERHPARVLILAVRDDSGPDVEAWVSAHCRNDGPHGQLCAEHVELRFHVEASERAASVVRTLLIGDLPTALWWHNTEPPALAGPLFEAFAGMAQQVIYDSVGWLDPARGIQAMSRWVRGGDHVVFNLAWRRLKPWRRILAQSLAPCPDRIDPHRIRRIEVRHGPHALPVVLLLMGWLASRLGWRAERARRSGDDLAEWRLSSASGGVELMIRRAADGPAMLRDLALEWPLGEQTGRASYHSDGLHVRLDAADSTLPAAALPIVRSEVEVLVSAQLAHRAGDQLYEQSLARAEELAAALSS